MQPLTVLSACAVILVLTTSVAPLPLETSELQQPTGNLPTPPEQGLAAKNLAASSSRAATPSPDNLNPLRVRMPRGVGFHEADYAVRAAAAVQTVIPALNTRVTPAALAAAAPTRAVFSRQSTCVTVSPAINCEPVPDQVFEPVSNSFETVVAVYEAAPDTDPFPYLASVVDPSILSLSDDSDAQPPPTTGDAPRPDSDDAPPTSTKKSQPTLKAQLDTLDRTVLVSKFVGSPATVVVSPDAGPESEPVSSAAAPSAVPHKARAVAAQSGSQRERRGRRLTLTRSLSGSSLHPDSDPNPHPHPHPINPRTVGSLPVAEPTLRAVLVKPSKGDTGVMRRTASPRVSVRPGVSVLNMPVEVSGGDQA